MHERALQCGPVDRRRRQVERALKKQTKGGKCRVLKTA